MTSKALPLSPATSDVTETHGLLIASPVKGRMFPAVIDGCKQDLP